MLHDFNNKMRFLNSLRHYDFNKPHTIKDDNITFERISNILSCELYLCNDSYQFDSTDNLAIFDDVTHYLEHNNRQLKPSDLNKILNDDIKRKDTLVRSLNKKSGEESKMTKYYVLTLLKGLKYCGNEESGIDTGYLYATSSYGANDRTRYVYYKLDIYNYF